MFGVFISRVCLRCCSAFIKRLGIWLGTPYDHQRTSCGLLAMTVIREFSNQHVALSICIDELYLSGFSLIAMCMLKIGKFYDFYDIWQWCGIRGLAINVGTKYT